jgi:hypothetical protein
VIEGDYANIVCNECGVALKNVRDADVQGRLDAWKCRFLWQRRGALTAEPATTVLECLTLAALLNIFRSLW